VAGVSFTVSGHGADTTVYSAFGGSGNVTAPYDLASMTTEIGLFAAFFRDNLNSPFTTIFEMTNEPWNFGSAFKQFFWLTAQSFSAAAQATGTLNGSPMRLYGYLATHMLRIIYETYGAANRSRWKGVMATQTGDPSVTTRTKVGYTQYMTDNPSLTYTINDLIDYVPVTGYFGTGTFSSANISTTNQWVTDSISRFNAALEPDQYAYFNRQMALDSFDGSLTGIAEHVTSLLSTIWPAARAGITAQYNSTVEMPMYEGGCQAIINTTQGAVAQTLDFWMHGHYSAEMAANYTAMMNNFIGYNGQMPSKYVEIGVAGVSSGAYGAIQFLGDPNTLVWDAVKAVNDA
jgi:hypothetical protein